jgi:hypothetical protein
MQRLHLAGAPRTGSDVPSARTSSQARRHPSPHPDHQPAPARRIRAEMAPFRSRRGVLSTCRPRNKTSAIRTGVPVRGPAVQH